jgi:hypothetical protein
MNFFSPFSLRRSILPLTRRYPSVPPGVSIRVSFHYRHIIMYKKQWETKIGPLSEIDATEVALHSDPLANWTYTRSVQTA